MSPQHDCTRCCLNRRQCLQALSASAIGAGLVASPLRSLTAVPMLRPFPMCSGMMRVVAIRFLLSAKK